MFIFVLEHVPALSAITRNKKTAASVVHIKILYIKTQSLTSLWMHQCSSPLKTTAPTGNRGGVLTALLQKMWTHR